MSTIIVMPQLGESVAEGVIGKWLKNEGDRIEKDEPIVEVITDKVNAEIPSPVAGVLERITQPEGATVEVGQEIAVIGDGEPSRQPGERSGAQEPVAAATGGPAGGNGQQPGGSPAASAPAAAGTGQVPAGIITSDPQRGERVRSSPLVRRLAEQHSINLSEVPGTGIGGRVSKQDVLQYVEHRRRAQPPPAAETVPSEPAALATETVDRTAPPVAAPAQPSSPSPFRAPAFPASGRELGPNDELVPVPPLRKLIASRMVQSTSTIPHATTVAEVDVSRVVRYRAARKDEFRSREGVPLSYVAVVVKATVEALKEFPMVNAEWTEDGIILKGDLNINVAVDAPDGLTTPVIHHADEKSLAGLCKAVHDLALRARDKQLKLEDMQGGTFTVNNTGALGSVGGVSIINYPQAAILAFGAIVKRPVIVEQDDQDLVAVRSMMNLSFSFDHRIMDGGYATGFVNAVKENLESWRADYPLY